MGFIGQIASGAMQMKQARLGGRQQRADIARQTAQRHSDELEDRTLLEGKITARIGRAGVGAELTPMDILADMERTHAENRRRIAQGGEAQKRRSKAEEQGAVLSGAGNILSGVAGLGDALAAPFTPRPT